MNNQLFFKREDLSAWTDGNQDLIRGFEQLVSTVQSALDKINTAQQTADNAVNLANGAYPISGSNSNGEYTQYPDGTMIQKKAGIIVMAGTNFVWTLPFPFIDTTYSATSSSATSAGFAGILAEVQTTPKTTTTITFSHVAIVGAGNGTFDLIAIGRWK